MTKVRIKKGDTVTVISGSHKGATGAVKEVIKKDASNVRVIVEGVNVKTKHVKPSQLNAGGIQKVERSIHISNVAVVDPKTSKPTRVSYKTVGDKKVRVARRSGEQIG